MNTQAEARLRHRRSNIGTDVKFGVDRDRRPVGNVHISNNVPGLVSSSPMAPPIYKPGVGRHKRQHDANNYHNVGRAPSDIGG
ncbi:hypothetical protein BZG13_15050 [Salinivibrio sp. ML323]|nr:hypothetical protein BZG13_15050 [Salinivibrio sp. ML323]